MGVFGVLKNSVKRSTSVADDLTSGASNVIETGVRRATSPLSIAAAGGAGAYSYGQYADVQDEQERTARYKEYQDRLASIEKQYERGEISRSEMKSLKEQARQDFYAAGDSDADNRGLTLTGLIAQMGTVQLVATAAVLSAGLYFVGRPIADAVAENDISLESLLG